MLGGALVHSAQAYHNLKNILHCVIHHLSCFKASFMASGLVGRCLKTEQFEFLHLNFFK